MKKHNSHIILETNSSQTHKYENDENGNNLLKLILMMIRHIIHLLSKIKN